MSTGEVADPTTPSALGHTVRPSPDQQQPSQAQGTQEPKDKIHSFCDHQKQIPLKNKNH